MNSLKTTERIAFILKQFREYKTLTLDKIETLLVDSGFEFSKRTLERDIERLRNQCFIEITYDHSNKFYSIAEESWQDVEQWMHVFELLSTAKTINETLFRSSKTIDYIDFDRSKTAIDTQLMTQLLLAVIEQQEIRFSHQNYWGGAANTLIIQPHLLKQYQNRWYVFGCFPNGEFRSFGLDRMHGLTLTGKKFKPKKKDPKRAFDDIVGLVYSISELETVVLSYIPEQAKYIKSQPVHASQEIIIDNDHELRIQLRVRPNYELEEQILKQGERVTVLEPEWLKNGIKQRLQKALLRYY